MLEFFFDEKSNEKRHLFRIVYRRGMRCGLIRFFKFYFVIVACLRHAGLGLIAVCPTLRNFVACEGLIGYRVFDTGRVCVSTYLTHVLSNLSRCRVFDTYVACTSSCLGLAASCLCGCCVFDTQLIQAGFLGFRVFDVR